MLAGKILFDMRRNSSLTNVLFVWCHQPENIDADGTILTLIGDHGM